MKNKDDFKFIYRILNSLYEKIKSEIEENQYIFALRILSIILIIPIIVWFLYYIGDLGFIVINTSLSIDGFLGFYGAFLSFLGTITLGILALWQNKKFKIENDISQTRLEDLTNQANEISKELMKLEKDKFRPYIRIDSKELIFAVSKEARGFGKSIEDKLLELERNIIFKGIVPFDEDNKEQIKNLCYPECVFLAFYIKNIGQAPIANLFIKKSSFGNGTIGIVHGFMSSADSSLLNGEKNRVVIKFISQVAINMDDRGNIIFNNEIYDYYFKQIHEEAINLLPIELSINYSDIYGREYEQEFSIHFQYDLEKETENEIIFKTKNILIQHHIDKSPFTPR